MNANPTNRHHITITNTDGQAFRLHIGDLDISNAIARFNLDVTARQGALLQLDLIAPRLNELTISNARVAIHPETQAVLEALGWTPPGRTPASTTCSATTSGPPDSRWTCILDPWHNGDHEATDGTQWSAHARP